MLQWKLLHDHLVNQPQHYERPQQTARIARALALVQEGLEELSRLGHHFELLGTDVPRDSWPRLVFHLQKAPRGFFCLSEFDFEHALGGTEAGWHDTLDEAKHSAGMDKQFTRGGVFPKRGLPALGAPEDLTPLEQLRRRGLLDSNGNRD